MIDEGELRHRFPEIPWDQPVRVTVIGYGPGRWVCRYCIARHGLRGEEIDQLPWAYETRAAALDHIEGEHHD